METVSAPYRIVLPMFLVFRPLLDGMFLKRIQLGEVFRHHLIELVGIAAQRHPMVLAIDSFDQIAFPNWNQHITCLSSVT